MRWQRRPESVGTPLKSFAVGLAGCSDREWACQVAGFLGTDHHEELMYYRIFRRHFGHEGIIRAIGRSRSLNETQRCGLATA